MDNCLKIKYEWDNCYNKIIIKYFNSDDNKGYYEEMNPCFENYKKYIECLQKNKIRLV